ncbi:hypothetical protein Aperf_G00000100568 [Anoplocephala perfoliata]
MGFFFNESERVVIYRRPFSPNSDPDKGSPVDDSDSNALVIDTGSSGCRVGLANEDGPSVITKFTTDSPIRHGYIVDCNKLEEHWREILNRPDIKYDGNPILFTVPQVAKNQEVEMITQIAFESLNATYFQIFNQCLLALYASGRTTGLVLDCGQELTHCVPINEGKIYYPGVVTLELGGVDLTKYLETLIGPHEQIEEIKENACIICPNRLNTSQWNSVECELSSGQVLTMGRERYDCPEPLFTPSLLRQELEPLTIHEAIYHSMRNCDADI